MAYTCIRSNLLGVSVMICVICTIYLFYSSSQQIQGMSNISLVGPQQIQKHQNNNSPSKVSFRFSKSKRFKDNNPECPIAFYSYKSQLSERTASIGNSKKIDLNNDLSHTPPSNLYDPNTYYDFAKSKGLSFAISRDQSPDQSYLIPQIHKFPGPANYDNDKAPRMTSSAYSMRHKTIDAVGKKLSYRKNPGPGAYQAVDLHNANLKTLVSKYKGASLCAVSNSPRFPKAKQCPGPQTYIDTDGLSAQARYVISQHRGRGTRPFTREKRFTHGHWHPSRNPAPTDYEKPSDFGQYGDAKYYKGLSTIG